MNKETTVFSHLKSTTMWVYWVFQHYLPKDLSRILSSQQTQWWINTEESTVHKLKVRLPLEYAPKSAKWMASGANMCGQLGLNHKDMVNIWTELITPVPFVQISSGETHVLALSEDGIVWSWGENQNGQLGFGDTEERLQPTKIPLDEPAFYVSAGFFDYSCVITKSGNVLSCGDNEFGRLGIDSTEAKSMSFQKVNIENAIQVQSGGRHSLCLTRDGTLFSWGDNGFGQLGTGNTVSASRPRLVLNVSNIQSIQAGSESSYYISKDGKLWGWGRNDLGQLGTGNNEHQFEAVEIALPAPPLQISAGLCHVLCICENNKLYSWGFNRFGQLGNGNTIDQTKPQLVKTGNEKIESTKIVGFCSFYITDFRELWGWGFNKDGELGLGHNIHQMAPVKSKLSQVVATQANSTTGSSFFAVRKD